MPIFLLVQDWFVKRASQTSWTSRVGETKTRCEKEKDGSLAGETLVRHMNHSLL